MWGSWGMWGTWDTQRRCRCFTLPGQLVQGNFLVYRPGCACFLGNGAAVRPKQRRAHGCPGQSGGGMRMAPGGCAARCPCADVAAPQALGSWELLTVCTRFVVPAREERKGAVGEREGGGGGEGGVGFISLWVGGIREGGGGGGVVRWDKWGV